MSTPIEIEEYTPQTNRVRPVDMFTDVQLNTILDLCVEFFPTDDIKRVQRKCARLLEHPDTPFE
jgi:hypothetical protein